RLRLFHIARSRAMLRTDAPSRRLHLRGAWPLLAGICFVALAQAQSPQPDNLLDQTRRVNAVAAQRLEAEVRGAILQAQRMSAAQPGKAVERLKAALTKLDDDTSLPEERRQSLQRMLQKRIKDIESGADAKALDEQQVQATVRRLENKREQEAKNSDDD